MRAGIAPPVFWRLTPWEFLIWQEMALPAADDGGLADDPVALKALIEHGFAR